MVERCFSMYVAPNQKDWYQHLSAYYLNTEVQLSNQGNNHLLKIIHQLLFAIGREAVLAPNISSGC